MQTVLSRASASLAIKATRGVLPEPPTCRLPTEITRAADRRSRLSHPRATPARAALDATDQRSDAAAVSGEAIPAPPKPLARPRGWGSHRSSAAPAADQNRASFFRAAHDPKAAIP